MLDNAHALLVGIANYRNVRKLRWAVLKDVQDIYDILIEPQICGYLPENVQILKDDAADLIAIRQALADLAQNTDPDSTVLIYISSHGGRIESGHHTGEYLLPVDVAYPPAEMLACTAISGDEFTEALAAIPARKVVVIFDCCHAGGIGQPKSIAESELKNLPETYYESLTKGTGRVILASSRSDESSYILEGSDNSLFTNHLLGGLRGGAASEDGFIRIFDLFEYLQPRVTGDKLRQHPRFKADLEENFPVALFLGGQKGEIAKDEQGFRYDAYISYVDQEPDSTWVWDTLVPRLEGADLRIAVSGDAEEPGVARVVNIERGIRQSKRTVLVLSDAYLADNYAENESVWGQTMGTNEGAYRLLPIKISLLDEKNLPLYISSLTTLNMVHPGRAEREFNRLVRALQGPLPQR